MERLRQRSKYNLPSQRFKELLPEQIPVRIGHFANLAAEKIRPTNHCRLLLVG